MKDFRSKVAVVTGAGSGIGQALAVWLSEAGATVVLADIRKADAEETMRMMVPLPEAHRVVAVDVADREAMLDLAKRTMDTYGRVDLVINNAGIAMGESSFHGMDMDHFERLMRVNFYGVLHGCEAFVPHLLERPEAALVNVSSVFGLAGIDSNSAYCASKFAVHGLSQALYREYRNTGLMVHTVHPGGIDTNITRNALGPSSYSEAFHAQFLKMLPQHAASIILKSIRRKKHRILIGREAYALDLVMRLMPVWGGAIANRIIRSKTETAQRKSKPA